jgi:hypothetical protein
MTGPGLRDAARVPASEEVEMDAFSLVVTVVALLGVAVLILLFERRRAREIERDLRSNARRQRARRPGPDRNGDRNGDGDGDGDGDGRFSD